MFEAKNSLCKKLGVMTSASHLKKNEEGIKGKEDTKKGLRV